MSVAPIFTRAARAMSTHLSEAQLRALSHHQLLQYTLSLVHPKPTADSHHALPRNKKRRKLFDMSRYGQRHIALRLVYAGWRFHGFAAQENSDNTVEHHLFAALMKTKLVESRQSCHYTRSGRTDVGVSALGQVIGLKVRSNVVPPSQGERELDFAKVLNGNLPQGIRVLAWAPVADGVHQWPTTYQGDPEQIRKYWAQYEQGEKVVDSDVRRPGKVFDARFDATYRSYKYFFTRGDLDIERMRTAAAYFEGVHDFRNFCKVDEAITNFERKMYNVEIRKDNGDGDEFDVYYIFVKGQAFLWHQVRCMAAVLFDIGMRREEPILVKRLLDDASGGGGTFSNGKPHYRMASPTPLLLYECAYPPSVVGFPQTFISGEENEALALEDGDVHNKRTCLERADADIALNYANTVAQASILRAMLYENDSLISGGDCRKGGVTFKQWRRPRNYLLDLNRGKHIAYDKRDCDDSVEMKQERAAARKKAREVAD